MAPGVSVSTTPEQLVDRLGTVLEDLLASSRHAAARLAEITDLLIELNAKLPSAASGVPPEGVGRSSVEIKSSVRGVDVSAKAYDCSPIGPVGTAAIDEYFRVLAEAQRRIQEGA